MNTDEQNLYEIIGLPQDASRERIEEQCIRLGERYLSEKNSGDLRAAIMFAQIEQAYAMLTDPVKRAAYDAAQRHKPAQNNLLNHTHSAAQPSLPTAKRWRVLPVEDAAKHPLYGVGGWLLLLVVGMMVLGPLLGAGSINADILITEHQYPTIISMDEWKTFKLATWSIFIAAAGLSIYGGWGLVRGKDWSVVESARAILWVSGPCAALVLGVIVPLFVYGDAEWRDAKFIGGLILSSIDASIWSAYLSKSRRVRVTFEHSVLDKSSVP